jgi:hypothetical protein
VILAPLAVVPAALLGWILVRLLLPAGAWRPAWIRWLMEISLGTGLGIGVTSCFYFVLVWAGLATRASELGLEAAVLAGAAWLLLRIRASRGQEAGHAPPRFSWNWALRLAAVLALLLFIMDFGEAIGASPKGEWDAVSTWNLRARFLAGGADTWRFAVSGQAAGKMMGATHPGYPLLVSGSAARLWMLTGDTSDNAPAALSLLFTLAALGLLCGAIAWMRAESAALLALLVCLATEGFVSQSASQYSDIPLAFYILATVSLLAYAAERLWPAGVLVLAGLSAGLAAWTKNEGLPFLLLAIVVVAWRGGARPAKWLALGAAPGALVTGGLKLLLAPPGGEAVFPKTAGEALTRLGNAGRWGEVAGSFVRSLADLGVWWAHPILLLAVLAFVLGFVKRREKSYWWLLLPLAGLLAADIGVYLTTTADLGWHLATSNTRLFVQIWPAMLFIFFLLIRPPVTPEPEQAVVATGKSGAETPQRRNKRAPVNS